MAFFRLVLFASKFNKVYKKVKSEKEAALAISKGAKPRYSWKSKLGHLRINCKKKVINCLTCLYILRNTALDRFLYRLRKYGSFENYILKSIFGFLAGYLLTYLLFLFLSIQLNVRLNIATLICCVLGCILTLGLAFSEKVRCIVLLTLPQFFSKRGRQALIAYALILTMTGPTKNILNNMGIMSESLACGQEQLKSAVRQILDVIKKPFVAIKEAIKAVVKAVKEVIKKIKDILIKIKRIIMAILDVIKAVFQFLGKILSICNKELGTPFDRCTRVFESAVTDCQAKLGSFFGWTCSIGYLLGSVCYIVKPFDLICTLVDFISNSIIGVVVRKVKIFIRHVKTMFYVRIKFSHSYHFQSNSSKTMKDVANSIMGEVKTRTRWIVSIIQFFNCAASLFFIFLIFRVISYRHKFLTKERFDNRFLTKNLADLDLRRAAMDKETILPLNRREKKKYLTVKSLRLLDTERKQLKEGISLLVSTAVKIAMHMVVDYSLYWIMMLIRKYGKFQSKVQTPNIPTIHIAGTGLLADLLKGIVKSFQPLGIALEIDTVPCLPAPLPPDIDRYIQIASILLACLILTIFEPYGLRWRHSILCYYYPKRAKERAIWLYNHILRSRSSFLKFARRQLRRKVLGTKKIEKVTCIEYLRSKTNNKCLLIFLGSDKQRACLFCGEIFRKSDKEDPVECQRPGCTAIYCRKCFEDLENVCTVCLSPIEYGDKSDISEEQDSSDESFAVTSFISSEDDDSGRSTQDEESTTDDYSYGYQESEKEPSKISDFKTSSTRDLEKQHIPDYASMQTFDDGMDSYSLSPSEYQTRGTQSQDDHFLTKKLISPEDHEGDSSSATSFRQVKIDHRRFLRNMQENECQCLSFDEVNALTAGLPLADRTTRDLFIEMSEFTNGRNISSQMTKQQSVSEEQCEELLIEFSSEGESSSSEESNLLKNSDKFLRDEADELKHKTEYQRRKPDDELSDSELSEDDLVVLMGISNKKSNEFPLPGNRDINNEEYTQRSPKFFNDVQEASGELSSSEATEQFSSPNIEDHNRSHLVTQSDSSITEFKRPSISSSRRDSFRQIEFVGIESPKNTIPSSKMASRKERLRRIPDDKIYQSTIATKTSTQNIPSGLKERKSILKLDSDSSVISKIAPYRKNTMIPKLNLTSLVGDTTDDERATSKRKKKYEYHKVSEKPRKRRKVFSTGDKRLKGGASSLNEDSELTFIREKRLLLDGNKYIRLHESQSFGSSSNYNCDNEEFTSPTYPFKSEYSNKSPDSHHLSQVVGSYNTSRLDARFFESSDSSITLSRIGRGLSELSHDFSLQKVSSLSMTTENISDSLQAGKTHRSPKLKENTQIKNNIRITKASEEKEGGRDEGEGAESDASSDISISVQENILGIPKKQKQHKIEKKPERELNNEILDAEEIIAKPKSPAKAANYNNSAKEENKKIIKGKDKRNKIESDEDIENTIDKKSIKKTAIENQPAAKTKTLQKQSSTSSSRSQEKNDDDQEDPEEYSNHSRNSKSSLVRELDLPPKGGSRFSQYENEKECSCCMCRNNFSDYQSPPERPHRPVCLHSAIDSFTQTHRDLSDRCCQIESCRMNTETASGRCFNKCCTARSRANDDSPIFGRRLQVNEQCLCNVCTRLVHQDVDEGGNYRRSPITKNIMFPDHPFSSTQKYEAPRKTVGTVCKPRMRDQTSYVKQFPQRNFNKCKVSFQQEGSNESLCSNCGYCRDLFDLPYQDNDEYTRLVRELEEKLVARNRERVRRTIRQFEECSSRNQNLRKPILYDESSCGEEPYLSQLGHLKAGDSSIRCCEGINKPSFPIRCRKDEIAGEKTVETMAKYLDPNQSDRLQRYPRVRNITDPSKWQLDKRTGEWCRVSGVNGGDTYDLYGTENLYLPPYTFPGRRISNRSDEGFRCDECDELNRRYGHRFQIVCCPRHRSNIEPRHRKM